VNINFGAKVDIVGHVILFLAVIEPFLYNPLMSDKLPNPHDLFFKGAFTRIEIVTGFIEHYLPKEITAHIDLSTVAVDLESYVSREFKEYFSDVVAQMQFLDGTLGEVYFLFEHKKGPEKLARLQILNYEIQKWFKLIREDEYEGYLPIIIPIIEEKRDRLLTQICVKLGATRAEKNAFFWHGRLRLTQAANAARGFTEGIS
jgi:hypothetical protein